MCQPYPFYVCSPKLRRPPRCLRRIRCCRPGRRRLRYRLVDIASLVINTHFEPTFPDSPTSRCRCLQPGRCCPPLHPALRQAFGILVYCIKLLSMTWRATFASIPLGYGAPQQQQQQQQQQPGGYGRAQHKTTSNTLAIPHLWRCLPETSANLIMHAVRCSEHVLRGMP